MAKIDTVDSKLEERVVRVNRVAKVVKGGRRFSFSAVVVVGDRNGLVGVGMGKAGEVPEAIRKGVEQARKSVVRVPLVGTSIPHRVDVRYGASKVMLKPAAPGTGVIAGGAVRAVVEAAGIRDILSKNYGSNNPVNVVKAAMKGLQEMRLPDVVAAARSMSLEEMGVRVAEPPATSSPVESAETTGQSEAAPTLDDGAAVEEHGAPASSESTTDAFADTPTISDEASTPSEEAAMAAPPGLDAPDQAPTGTGERAPEASEETDGSPT